MLNGNSDRLSIRLWPLFSALKPYLEYHGGSGRRLNRKNDEKPAEKAKEFRHYLRPALLAGLTGAITSDNKIYKLRARPLRWVVCSASGTWTASSRGTEVHFALVGRCPRQIDGAQKCGFREEDRFYCATHHQLLVNPTLGAIFIGVFPLEINFG